MVKKAAERREIKFLFLAIGQSNPPPFSYKVSDGIKPLWDETAFPDLIIFLDVREFKNHDKVHDDDVS